MQTHTPHTTHEPPASERTPTRLGALVMLAVPALVVLTAAVPAFTAGVVVTSLVALAVDRLQGLDADPAPG
jgi:hypothetical protein